MAETHNEERQRLAKAWCCLVTVAGAAQLSGAFTVLVCPAFVVVQDK